MNRTIKIVGGIVTGLILVGAALLSKDDEAKQEIGCKEETKDGERVVHEEHSEVIIDTTAEEVEA